MGNRKSSPPLPGNTENLNEMGINTVPMKVSGYRECFQFDGWFLVATRGSHGQFKHTAKPGRVTVTGTPNDDLAPAP